MKSPGQTSKLYQYMSEILSIAGPFMGCTSTREQLIIQQRRITRLNSRTGQYEQNPTK